MLSGLQPTQESGAIASESERPNEPQPLVIHDNPYNWGRSLGVWPDIDGDGLGDIVLNNGRSRSFPGIRNVITAAVDLHSGASGRLLGSVEGLAFLGGSLGVPAGARGASSSRPALVGVLGGSALRASWTEIDPLTLTPTARFDGPQIDFSKGVSPNAVLRAQRTLAIKPMGPEPRRFVFVSLSEHGAWAFGEVGGVGPELSELSALRLGTDYHWGELASTPDIDGDGWDDFAVTQISSKRGNALPNQVLVLSGQTGAPIRTLQFPSGPNGLLGGLASASAQNRDWVFLGSPGHFAASGDRVVDGALWRWDLGARSALPELVRISTESLGHKHFVNEHDDRLPDFFGETVRSFHVAGRPYVAVSDSGQVPGVVYTLDADSGKVERRVEGSMASANGGDWLFGKECWGPLAGTESHFVVHAATAHGMGRIVVIDFATGQSIAVISRTIPYDQGFDTSR